MLIRIGYDVALRLYHPDVPITMVFGSHRLEKFSVVTGEVKLDDILNPGRALCLQEAAVETV
jgi:hypothetical protein